MWFDWIMLHCYTICFKYQITQPKNRNNFYYQFERDRLSDTHLSLAKYWICDGLQLLTNVLTTYLLNRYCLFVTFSLHSQFLIDKSNKKCLKNLCAIDCRLKLCVLYWYIWRFNWWFVWFSFTIEWWWCVFNSCCCHLLIRNKSKFFAFDCA